MKSKLLLIVTFTFLLASVSVTAVKAKELILSDTSREIAVTFDDLPGVQMAGGWCKPKIFEDVKKDPGNPHAQ